MQKNNLRFCANISLLFNELPLRERFAAAKQAGFNAIEMQFPYETPLQELIQLQQENQLHIVLINVAAGDLMQGGEGLAAVPHKQAEFDAALSQCLEYARALKVECVNVLPGRCINKNQYDSYLATYKTNLLKAANALQAINIKCTFEAINTSDMPHFLIHNSTQMHSIIAELKHPNIFMQYDIYHMTKMGMNIIDDLNNYAAEIGHVQFADCPGRAEPGTGNIDFDAIFSALSATHYSGWVGAEYKPSQTTLKSLHWYY